MKKKTAYEFKIARVQEVGEVTAIVSPEEAVDYWRRVVEKRSWYQSNREHVITIHLDAKNRATGHHLVGVGTANECLAHPRDIFAAALCASASSVILMHNHPSGDPEPSRADITLTNAVKSGGELLHVRLTDHVIVGSPNKYFSFREFGIL
jgi:DNA repair protein RadC